MISKTLRKKLKKHLKDDYTEDVQAKLKTANVVNSKNNPHGESMIRLVFNGYREDIDIEAAILEVYEDRLALANSLKTKHRKILSA